MYCEVRDAATILFLGRRGRYAFVIDIDIMYNVIAVNPNWKPTKLDMHRQRKKWRLFVVR